ncbi:cytochrome P450 [Sphaerisporangium dianthi]|uniref:Cytochrome P450 n=1 Tax=Sphaerisporangium dianthi TaxID=1436120 RepID=A0ABV9CVD3_9ACTN
MTGVVEDLDFPIRRTEPFRPPIEYAKMRSTGAPVRVRLYNRNPAWVVTRYADIRAVLGDERFSSDISHPGYPVFGAELEIRRHIKTLVTLDPPEHTRLRRMVVSEFTAKRMNSLRDQVRRTADELVDVMLAAGGPVNLAESYSFPLAGSIVGNLLGVPPNEIEQLMSATRALARAGDLASVGARIVAFKDRLTELVAEKQREPADDVLSRIVARHVATGALTPDELVTLTFVVIGAGYNPAANMISLGVLLLLEHPDQLDAVRADPAMMPNAVEELLRYVSVSDLSALRVAVTDVEIGGRLIRAGEGVIVPNGAANHDPEVFPEPARLDLTRPARMHLAFGHGIHQCLGGNMMRVELGIAYQTLITRIPGLRFAVPAAEISATDSILTEIHDLPVTW